jgi:hypothetical protein
MKPEVLVKVDEAVEGDEPGPPQLSYARAPKREEMLTA